MAWFKMHQELFRHPKLKRFARQLGISEPTAVGHLCSLWSWAMDYAQDGDLTRFKEDDIAFAMQWEGEPGEMVEALITCGVGGDGFLERADDGRLVLHNWEEHCGARFRQRSQGAERIKRHRERRAQKTQTCNAHVTRYTCVTDALQERYTCVSNATVTRGEEKRGEEKRGEERKGEEILASASIEAEVVPAIAGTASTAQSETQKQPEESGETATQTATQKTAAILTQVIALWNTELTPLGFPRIAKMTPAREKAFHARLAEQTERHKLEWWQERISQLGASEFMCSSAREKANWLTFDWLLNENNLVKVLEGKYDSDRVTRPRSQPRMSLSDMPDDIDAFEAALGIRRDGGNVITLDAAYRAKEETQ